MSIIALMAEGPELTDLDHYSSAIKPLVATGGNELTLKPAQIVTKVIQLPRSHDIFDSFTLSMRLDPICVETITFTIGGYVITKLSGLALAAIAKREGHLYTLPFPRFLSYVAIAQTAEIKITFNVPMAMAVSHFATMAKCVGTSVSTWMLRDLANIIGEYAISSMIESDFVVYTLATFLSEKKRHAAERKILRVPFVQVQEQCDHVPGGTRRWVQSLHFYHPIYRLVFFFVSPMAPAFKPIDVLVSGRLIFNHNEHTSFTREIVSHVDQFITGGRCNADPAIYTLTFESRHINALTKSHSCINFSRMNTAELILEITPINQHLDLVVIAEAHNDMVYGEGTGSLRYPN
jgi:hypothetical protein